MIRKKPSVNAQPLLFDDGSNSQETRRAAATAAIEKLPTRASIILDYLRAQGSRGATRDECSVATGLLIQSITGPMLDLLKAGLAKRPTAAGQRDPAQWPSLLWPLSSQGGTDGR